MNPRPLTMKQEAFCQAFAKGKTRTEAYKAVYNAENMKPQTIYTKAYDLFQNEKITSRIDELMVPAVKALHYSVETAMSEAKQAMDFAVECGNPGALVAAITLRAKISGLLIDKKEIKVGPLDKLSHDDLRALTAAFSTYDGATGEPLAIAAPGPDEGSSG